MKKLILFKKTKHLFFNLLLFGGLLLFGSLLMSGCSKKDDIKAISSGSETSDMTSSSFASTQLLFDNYVKVSYARDDMQDITEQFNDFSLYLSKSSMGVATGTVFVSNDLLTVYGKWQASITTGTNPDKIIFILPTDVHAQLAFFNKEWSVRMNGTEEVKLISATGGNDEIDLVPAEE